MSEAELTKIKAIISTFKNPIDGVQKLIKVSKAYAELEKKKWNDIKSQAMEAVDSVLYKDNVEIKIKKYESLYKVNEKFGINLIRK